MTELIIAVMWLSLGWLGTYIGLRAFRRRYGNEISPDSGMWFLAVFGPLNLVGMMLAVKPWDRSRDI